MARAGLEKSDVRKARDSLIAQSQYPSVDAVRIALGNTGSKTTIHKYLRELEEEEGGGAGRKASISEALQDLVERLAARLAEEADVRIEQVTQEFQAKEQAHAQAFRQLQSELLAKQEANRVLEERLQTEIAGHAKTSSTLQAETVARHTAVQQVADLKDRLEQAKLELRQQQLAVRGKQDEVTKLNQEGARLVLELSHTKQSLYEQLTNGRKLEQKIEQLQAAHLHTGDLQRQLVSKIAEAEVLSEQLKAAEAQLEPAKARLREFELLLAQANAKVQAQDQIGEQLQAYLDKMTAGSKTKAK
nr:DNA-binding protein [uncultured Duganella sp.]